MAKVKELKLELQLVQAQLLKTLKDKLESNPNLNIIEVKALCREFYNMQDNFVSQFENIVAEFEETLLESVDKEI